MTDEQTTTHNPADRMSSLWTIAGLLTLITLIIGGYKIRQYLQPSFTDQAPLNLECDLRHAPCITILPKGGSVSFSMTPQSIPVLKPIELDVNIEGLDVDSVEIDFAGVDMEMGYLRPKLQKDADGHFKGMAVIPVCVRSSMEWEARILMHSGDRTYMAPFRFFTYR